MPHHFRNMVAIVVPENCFVMFCNTHNGHDLRLFNLVGWDRSFFSFLLGPPRFN